MTANSLRLSNGQFVPGHSGNPGGKVPGVKTRLSKRLFERVEGEYGAIIDTLINAAKKGDVRAATFLASLIVPKAKFITADAADLPEDLDLATAEGLAVAHGAVVAAAASGRIDPDAANALSALIGEHRRVLETVTLERRIRHIEARKVVNLDDLPDAHTSPLEAGEDDRGDS